MRQRKEAQKITHARTFLGEKNGYEANSTESKFWDLVEVVCCFMFMVVASILPTMTMDPPLRPIPHQRISKETIALDLRLNEDIVETEIISGETLLLVSFLMPFLLQLLLSSRAFRGNIGKVQASACAYFVALGLTNLSSEFLKHYIGSLRPHFYAACNVNFNTMECNDFNGNRQGRLSFPSGHASMSFCTMTLLSLYLQQEFGAIGVILVSDDAIFQPSNERKDDSRKDNNDDDDGIIFVPFVFVPRRQSSLRLTRAICIVCLLPLLVALFIASSRVVDNHHHPVDILCGAVLGSACALWTHALWSVEPRILKIYGCKPLIFHC